VAPNIASIGGPRLHLRGLRILCADNPNGNLRSPRSIRPIKRNRSHGISPLPPPRHLPQPGRFAFDLHGAVKNIAGESGSARKIEQVKRLNPTWPDLTVEWSMSLVVDVIHGVILRLPEPPSYSCVRAGRRGGGGRRRISKCEDPVGTAQANVIDSGRSR